ncbi:MAG: T9SS type A sorting domain-containing protein [Bacteroidota bacterium]|nr:T9SS type A sorting domain-containing protein [Bacteroidota bacterium]
MKKSLLIAIIFFSGLTNIHAQVTTDSCLSLINGALKGQPGNIQDNMFHNLMIDPNNPNIVYAGTETSGMFKTTDGGQTWQRLRQGLKCTIQQTGYSQIFNITADPINVNIVYASTVSGPGPVTGYLYPSASAGLYKSIDAGLTWQQRNNGFTNSYNTFLSVNPTNSQELFTAIGGMKSTQPSLGGAFFTGGLYRSTNAGNSWIKLNTPILADSNASWGIIYAAQPNSAIYCSWHTHDAGIPSLGLTKSTDNGNSWSVINPSGIVIGNFDVFKKNGNYIIGTDNTSNHFAYASSDGGANWTPLNKKFYGAFQMHPTDSSIVFFLGGGKTINRTTNSFQTSQIVHTDSSLISGQYMEDIKISESNPNIVWVCAQGYYLYKSSDGGASFTKITAVRDSIYGITGIGDMTDNESTISIFPNPFSNSTSIDLHLLSGGKVSIVVFNTLGQKIITVLNGEELSTGNHSFNLDLTSLPSGMYNVLININDKIVSKKIIHLN